MPSFISFEEREIKIIGKTNTNFPYKILQRIIDFFITLCYNVNNTDQLVEQMPMFEGKINPLPIKI